MAFNWKSYDDSPLQRFDQRSSRWRNRVRLVLQNIASHRDLLSAVQLFDAHHKLHASWFLPPRESNIPLAESDMRTWDPRLLEALLLLPRRIENTEATRMLEEEIRRRTTSTKDTRDYVIYEDVANILNTIARRAGNEQEKALRRWEGKVKQIIKEHYNGEVPGVGSEGDFNNDGNYDENGHEIEDIYRNRYRGGSEGNQSHDKSQQISKNQDNFSAMLGVGAGPRISSDQIGSGIKRPHPPDSQGQSPAAKRNSIERPGTSPNPDKTGRKVDKAAQELAAVESALEEESQAEVEEDAESNPDGDGDGDEYGDRNDEDDEDEDGGDAAGSDEQGESGGKEDAEGDSDDDAEDDSDDEEEDAATNQQKGNEGEAEDNPQVPALNPIPAPAQAVAPVAPPPPPPPPPIAPARVPHQPPPRRTEAEKLAEENRSNLRPSRTRNNGRHQAGRYRGM